MNQSIPATMQAVQQDEPGGTLTLREVPVPRPRAGQVLVRMAASPVNPSDLSTLIGTSSYRKHRYPFIPGIEGSGTVVEAGEGFIPGLLNGRRVACSSADPNQGTWAEYAVTSAKSCVPLGSKVNMEQGAMLLVNPMSALGIFDVLQKGGHRAMVSTAAASALGGMLLRLGKRFGVPVIHVVRRQEQVELVRERGGEVILNSSDEDFVEQLTEAAHRVQATLFLDAVAGNMTQKLAQAAPYGSSILLYSNLALKDSGINPGTALSKHLKVQGWLLPNWLREKNIFQVLQLAIRARSLLATDLQSPVYKTFPLGDAQAGIETYMNKMSSGKILFTP